MRTSTAHPARSPKRTGARRLVAALLLGGLLAGSSALAATAARAQSGSEGLVELPTVLQTDREKSLSGPHDPPPMIVDPVNNLGFALGQKRNQSNQFRLVMFDLVGLRQVGEMPISGLASDDIFTFAVDPETRRLIYASRPSFAPTTAVCGDTPVALVPKGTFLNVVTYDFDAAAGQGAMQLHQPGLPIPCAGRKAMQFNTMSFYEVDGKKKLLATGTYSDESYHYGHPTDFNLHDNLGQSLIIRQFDADELFARQGTLTPDPGSLEWEVDLRTVGCGRIDVHLVQRVGDSVISLCSDTRPVASYAVGEQGYVVRIPLGADHRPIPRGGTASGDPANPTNDAFIANPTVRRTPSLAGKVFPFLDPGSGRLQLLTANNANGNAVWVFDPTDERFLGVMTGGVVGQTAAKTAAGFDRDNGRAYLLTNRGILAASVRPSPLPGGQLYPVVDGEYDDAGNLVNPENVSSLAIAVAPKLRRLFVPVVDKGYVVVEDHSADPPALPPVDPDEFTNQIEEREGETEVNASGAAIASGVNIIGSGGVPRIANQLDPLCHSPHPAWETNVAPNFREQLLFNGKCLADQLATPGNRNVVIAGSKASAASGADATASSNGLAFAETDHATNRDVKELGDCGYGYMERLQQPFVWMSQQDTDPSNDHTPQSPRGQDGGFCGQVQGGLAQALGDDLRNGTHGGTGTGSGAGFPFPGAECSDFGGEPGGASAPGQSPKGAAVAANVACDSASGTASAAASAAPLAVPSPADPLVSVGKTWTDIATTRTDLGQVTVATAVAQGVRIGPLSIGEVRSLATSRAKGRTGTAAVDFERRWCGISLTEALGAVPDAGVSTPAVPGVPGGPPTSPADPVFEAGLLTNDCIDPDTDPLARQLVDELNQAVGKVRVSIPDVRADATDGGYQAVVTKHPDVRAADQAVNDDDSHTVPALQAVIYNDGPEGRNRVVVQFAGVHTEARYGIVPLPSFDIPDFPDPETPVGRLFTPPTGGTAGTPATVRFLVDEVEVIPAVAGRTVTGQGGPTLADFFASPAQALQRLLRWMMQNLTEAALLFLVFSILATPIYLTIRARAAARELGL